MYNWHFQGRNVSLILPFILFIFEVLCLVQCCVTLIIDNCTVRYSASPHSHGLLTSRVQVPVLGAAVLPLRLRHLDVRGGEQSQLAAQLPDVADAGQEEPRRGGRVGGALQDLPLRLSAQRHGQAGGLWLHLLQRCK